MRPPLVAGLLLILGVAAALPFRRTHRPHALQSQDARAAQSDASAAPGAARTAASPLRVTSNPQRTARGLLADFPTPSAERDIEATPAPQFRETYAERAIEWVELPRRVDAWDPELRLPLSQERAAERLAADAAPAEATEPPGVANITPVTDRTPTPRPTIHQPAERPQQEARPEESYRWESFGAPQETPAAEELPVPKRRERVSENLPATDAPPADLPSAAPASTMMQPPAARSTAVTSTTAGDRAPQQPQPRRRYFIREPAFDSAMSR